MSEKSSGGGGGVGFFGLLGLLFIGLKLGKVIDWSWFWVLCPLWGPLAVGLTLMAIGGIGLLILKVIEK